MAKNKKGGLGRGIEALFAENEVTELADETVQDIKLSLIHPNPYQPRRTFDKEALAELASSIEKSGVFQPIILRQTDPKINRYELIAGEAYQMLMDKLSLTQAQVANRLGKSRPYIANYLRLLGLPKVIKEFLNTGKLSMGQARTILGLKDKTKLVPLAQRAVEQNLTVRQLEEIVTQTNGTAKKKEERRTQRKPVYIREAESQLQSKFGTKVAVAQSRKKGAGKIEIPYTSNEDFTRILELLNITLD